MPKSRAAHADKTSAKPRPFAAVLRAELPMICGLIVTAVVHFAGHRWTHDFSNLAVTSAVFVVLFAVMIWCASVSSAMPRNWRITAASLTAP